MGYEIDLSVKPAGKVAILNIAGDITSITGSSVEQACNTADIIASHHILMNFDSSCYFNSGGIAYLIDIALKSQRRGQTVMVTGLSDHFKKIFTMVGLTRCIEIHDTVSEAMKLQCCRSC